MTIVFHSQIKCFIFCRGLGGGKPRFFLYVCVSVCLVCVLLFVYKMLLSVLFGLHVIWETLWNLVFLCVCVSKGLMQHIEGYESWAWTKNHLTTGIIMTVILTLELVVFLVLRNQEVN